MKNFKTKLLGVLVLGAISCISTVSAANITIGQRNSYGVLNLTKLILKSGTSQNTTGIVFDGNEKTITFTTDTEGNSIILDGLKKGIRFLFKDKPSLELVGGDERTITFTTPDGKTTLRLIGTKREDSSIRVSRVCDVNGENCANIADLISGGNGSGGNGGGSGYTVVTGSNGTRCTFEDGNFNCNNATPAGGDLDVRGDNGKRCKYVCEKNVSNGNITCGIQCLADAPTGGSGNSVTIGGDSGKICTKVNDTEIECNLDADSLGGSTTINMPSGSGISISGTNGYLCTKNGSTSLKCTTNPATLGGGESLWKETTKNIYNGISYSNINVLTPKNSTPLYFSTDFYHNTAFNFYTFQGNQGGGPSTRVTFNQKGIRIGNGNQFFSGAGISVAGTIAAGNTAQNNYIYIYTTGTANDPDLRYEIFGSRKLAIGTSSGSYIYFMEKDGTTNAFRVGINNTDPKATLDVKGGIKVGSNCEQQTCTLDRVGTILYHNNKGFVGCKYKGGEYKRVSLDGGTWSGTTLGQDTQCNIAIYSNPSQYIMNNTTATQ